MVQQYKPTWPCMMKLPEGEYPRSYVLYSDHTEALASVRERSGELERALDDKYATKKCLVHLEYLWADQMAANYQLLALLDAVLHRALPEGVTAEEIVDAVKSASDLLRAIEQQGGLMPGGEQYPNAECCLDQVARLQSILAILQPGPSRAPLI